MAPPVVIRFVTLVAAVFVSTTVFDYRFVWAESAVDFVQDVVPILRLTVASATAKHFVRLTWICLARQAFGKEANLAKF